MRFVAADVLKSRTRDLTADKPGRPATDAVPTAIQGYPVRVALNPRVHPETLPADITDMLDGWSNRFPRPSSEP